MIRNWPRAFAHLGKHLRSLTSGRFWTRAARVLIHSAPPSMALVDANDPSVAVLSNQSLVPSRSQNSPIASAGLHFPFHEYRNAINSGLSTKARWAHRVTVRPPNGPDFEILVLYIAPNLRKIGKEKQHGQF